MCFPMRSENITDRFVSKFGLGIHFESSKTASYCVFYDQKQFGSKNFFEKSDPIPKVCSDGNFVTGTF